MEHGTGSLSCPMAEYGISGRETQCSVTTDLVCNGTLIEVQFNSLQL